jgi:hypothetical protein
MTQKIVQTVLDDSEYEEFRKASQKSKKTIRQAAKEAIQRWTQEVSGISPEDPIFRLKPVSYRSRKASEEHDLILYGSHRSKN